MLTLTKKVEFALIILKYLQEKQTQEFHQTVKEVEKQAVIKAYQIAQAHKISENFVSKVMQKLCRKQILLSKQGAQGGYYLHIDLGKISLLQLVEILEGHFTIVNCINEDKTCIYDQGCNIIDPMRHLNAKFRKIYGEIMLSEILIPFHQSPADRDILPASESYPPNPAWSTPSPTKPSVTGNVRLKKTSLKLNSIKLFASILIMAFLFLSFGQAQSMGEVNVYSYRQKFLIEGILDKFTEITGIKANVIFIDKGLTERIQMEGPLSPADVILTTDIGQLEELEKRDIVQPVRSSLIEEAIPTHLRHSQGLWAALTTRSRIIYASKERVKEGEIKDYADLAKPKWKNRVCIRSGYHPYNLALFSSLIAHEGEKKTEDFLRKLRSNLARKPQGNDRAQIKAIKEELCDLSVGNSYYYALMLFNYDSPEEIQWAKAVNLIFPNQENWGTHYNVSGMALAKYSPNREQAVKLMEFLVSDLAQYIYASENYEFPVKAGTPLPSFLKTYMADVKWDTISLEKVASLRRKVTLLLDKIQFDR